MKFLLPLALLWLSPPATSQDQLPLDPQLEQGKRVFRQCKACHTTDKDARHLAGPNLFGVFDRPAASAPGFTGYSVALRESSIQWNAETLGDWLSNPNSYLPGNRMSFVGVSNARDRDALIAWLRHATTGTDDKEAP